MPKQKSKRKKHKAEGEMHPLGGLVEGREYKTRSEKQRVKDGGSRMGKNNVGSKMGTAKKSSKPDQARRR